MSEIIKRKYKCTGCGNDRPCIVETNQEKVQIAFYDEIENLKCILDETNQTSYNWKEVKANEETKETEKALVINGVSQQRELFLDLLRFNEEYFEKSNCEWLSEEVLDEWLKSKNCG